MVDTPTPNAGGEPVFLNYSQGRSADTGQASMLGLVSDVIKGGIDAVDSAIKYQASEDVRTQVQAVQDKTISNYMLAGNPPADVPPQINAELDRAAKLQNANRMGIVRDSYYNLQIDQIARELRYKYSGYKDYIDGRISDMTGIKPAAAVIKSLKQDVYDSMPAEDKRVEAVRQDLIKQGINIAEMEAKRGGRIPLPEMESMQANEYKIVKNLQNIAAINTAKTGIASNDKKVFMTNLNETLGQDFDAFAKQGFTSKGVNLDSVVSMATKFQADPNSFTGPMQEELRTNIGELRLAYESRVMGRLHNRNGGMSMIDAGKMDLKDVEETKKLWMDRFDSFYQPLLDKNWGAFAANARVLETSQAIGQVKALQNEHIRAFSIAKDVLGPQVAGQLLSLNGGAAKLVDGVNQTAKEIAVLNIVTKNTDSIASADSKLRGKDNPHVDPGKVADSAIETLVGMVLNKTGDPIVKTNAAYGLFSPKNVGWIGNIVVKDASGNIKPDESKAKQMEIFQKLTTQDITNQMKDIGSREPRALQGYIDFSLNTGLTVNKTTLDNLKSGFVDRTRYSAIVFNGKEFEAIANNPTGSAAYNAATPSTTQRVGDMQEAKMMAADLNRLNNQLMPIMKLQGNDPANSIRELYGRVGINIDALSPAANGGKLGGRLGNLGSADTGTQPFDFGQTMQDNADRSANQNNNAWSYEQVSHGISQQFVEASNMLAKDPTNTALQKEVEAAINAMKDHVAMGREAFDAKQLTQKADRSRRTLVDTVQ